MADEALQVDSNAPAAIDPIKSELDQQMAISLNGGLAPVAAVQSAAAAPAPETSSPPSDPFGLFKEKFGYETPEAAVQDIEALRAFRASPPTAELKFENEQSKIVAELLQSGKLEDVYTILDQQMKIDRLTNTELTSDTAADIVKLGMQIKYKDLTAAEINYKFNKQYAIPAKPAQLSTEEPEEYNERVAAWQAIIDDRRMELMIEAKLAKPDLIATKSKLVFPTIARPQDAEFQEWQKSIQEDKRLTDETVLAYKAFTPTSLTTKINFKDEPNKIDFDFIDEPDPESFKVTQNIVSDINELWNRFINPDGTPDRQGFMKFVHRGLNFDKMVLNAINQTKNATIKASLPDNSTGGLVRQMPQTQEPNELDAMMRASLKGYGGF